MRLMSKISVNNNYKIAHFFHGSLGAKKFIEPIILDQQQLGYDVTLYTSLTVRYKSLFKSSQYSLCNVASSLTLNPLKLLFRFKKVSNFIKENNFDLIEAHTLPGATIPLVAAYYNRVPIRIYHSHGLPFLGYKGLMKFLLIWLERVNAFFASHILTVSPGMKDAWETEVLRQENKVSLIGPGTISGLDFNLFDRYRPIDKIAQKQKLGYDGSEFILLYVGRPVKRKGFHFVLNTWSAIQSNLKNAELWICGCEESEVERVIGPLTNKKIRNFGFVPDLRNLYVAADVVTLPSWHEGFGYALLEGAASGCCLLSTDIPGPDALVIQGETGVTHKPENTEEYVCAIKKLYEDRVWLNKLGNSARKQALKYDRSYILNEYAKFISQALNDF